MELNSNKQYLVYNYSPSAVAVATRYNSYTIPGGTHEQPSSFPLTLEEIMFINNSSSVFKYGLLWFEEQYAEALYEKLRIHNYKDILTDDEIEYILLNPTSEGLRRLIGITSDTYFNRVRGVYIRLKNTADVSTRVGKVIDLRYEELRDKKIKTAIVIEDRIKGSVPSDKETEELRSKVNELTAMVEKLTSALLTKTETAVSPDIEPAPAPKKSKTAKAEKAADTEDKKE